MPREYYRNFSFDYRQMHSENKLYNWPKDNRNRINCMVGNNSTVYDTQSIFFPSDFVNFQNVLHLPPPTFVSSSAITQSKGIKS